MGLRSSPGEGFPRNSQLSDGRGARARLSRPGGALWWREGRSCDPRLQVRIAQIGGDLIQRVVGPTGQVCGSMLWEAKRTKNWADGWLGKLREDQRAAKADMALIVSQALPKGLQGFDQIDGVWVTEPRCAVAVAIALRESLIALSAARLAGEGQQTKMELVYQYLTGPRFRHRIEAVVEHFSDMQADLDDALDVSNSNTPGVVDPTNPVNEADFRVVAQVDGHGKFRFAKTNAYSGNNGRAAILNNTNGANILYTAGNAGNGSNPQPNGVIVGAGAQILAAQTKALLAQDPGLPTPVGSFNITQLGDKPDKIGKDTNFRGLTIFNNVLYTTKGSGGNGINTVYFIDTSGFNNSGQPLACPNGVGIPNLPASLPTTPIVYNAAALQMKGVVPYNMCILNGFTTTLAKNTTISFPFGIWFANATTLYVADEGNGDNTYSSSGGYTGAAAQTTAGLQKWVFSAGSWKLAYTLTDGLGLGVPYTVSNYPSGNNPATGLPWSPATDGLRNITGRVNGDGTATIWASLRR
jgi:hypothetical protein